MAPTLDAYIDRSTLKNRLRILANAITRQYSSEDQRMPRRPRRQSRSMRSAESMVPLQMQQLRQNQLSESGTERSVADPRATLFNNGSNFTKTSTGAVTQQKRSESSQDQRPSLLAQLDQLTSSVVTDQSGDNSLPQLASSSSGSLNMASDFNRLQQLRQLQQQQLMQEQRGLTSSSVPDSSPTSFALAAGNVSQRLPVSSADNHSMIGVGIGNNSGRCDSDFEGQEAVHAKLQLQIIENMRLQERLLRRFQSKGQQIQPLSSNNVNDSSYHSNVHLNGVNYGLNTISNLNSIDNMDVHDVSGLPSNVGTISSLQQNTVGLTSHKQNPNLFMNDSLPGVSSSANIGSNLIGSHFNLGSTNSLSNNGNPMFNMNQPPAINSGFNASSNSSGRFGTGGMDMFNGNNNIGLSNNRMMNNVSMNNLNVNMGNNMMHMIAQSPSQSNETNMQFNPFSFQASQQRQQQQEQQMLSFPQGATSGSVNSGTFTEDSLHSSQYHQQQRFLREQLMSNSNNSTSNNMMMQSLMLQQQQLLQQQQQQQMLGGVGQGMMQDNQGMQSTAESLIISNNNMPNELNGSTEPLSPGSFYW